MNLLFFRFMADSEESDYEALYLIRATAEEFDGYTPNVKPRSEMDARVSSSSFFFFEFGAESLTYEIGDNTPRDFVLKKGEVSAMKLFQDNETRISSVFEKH